MSIDDKIEKSILAQFIANKRKNLFYKNIDRTNHFLPETRELIINHKEELEQIERLNLSDKWIDLMTNMALQTFYSSNQYIDFNQTQICELREIYRVLWKEILAGISSESNYEIIQKTHLNRLSTWLIKSNAFIKDINGIDYPEVIDVVCAEYSALLQSKLLQLDITNLIEPVLDIGCGENAWLVRYLKDIGIDSYGVDRMVNGNANYLYRTNWLEFDFKPHYWGTIVSNLSFALHFINHHQRKDGNYETYAKKYMEILNSLKINGSFYYAPSLPFIESLLPKVKYQIINKIINKNFSNTILKRIS